MGLWIIFAAMSLLAAAVVLRPLLAKRRPAADRSDFEAAIYREQLKSLDSEIASGAIAPKEAESTRAEIGRRLLAVAGQLSSSSPQDTGKSPAVVVAVAVLVLLPASALGLYAHLGAPEIPAAPAASRTVPETRNQSVDQLIAKVQQHLAINPTDFRGWQVLGPALLRIGRYTEAAEAYRRMNALEGPTAKRLSAMAEALMFANRGIISTEAGEAFAQAAAMDKNLPDPQFYLGLAKIQDGDKQGAVAIWKNLLDNSPADAPWRAEITAQIARVTGQQVAPALPGSAASGPLASGPDAPGPDADDIAAAGQMSAVERKAMISSMVARLDERLTEDGGTAQEWLRLVNAFGVMGDTNAREGAIVRARKALRDDNDGLKKFEAGIGPAAPRPAPTAAPPAASSSEPLGNSEGSRASDQGQDKPNDT